MTNNNSVKVTVFSSRYKDEKAAKEDYYKVKECYETNNVLDDFNGAVALKNSKNKIEIIVKNEYATRQKSWLGILIGFSIGVFTILFVAILIPDYFSQIAANEQHYTPLQIIVFTAFGGFVGGFLGHMQSGIGRSDLKELAKVLETNEYGLLVVSFGDMAHKVEKLLSIPSQVSKKEFDTTKRGLVGKIKRAFKH